MGFLDKNTRVLDVILTDYGREQYSKGELDFEYYALSDDEVDYDPYISNSGSLSLVQIEEEKVKQIEATLVREAIFGLSKGLNNKSEDETNIQNLLFTIPQGQLIVPEMVLSPDIESGSLNTKQQQVIERHVSRDRNGDVINVISDYSRGYRKFDVQKIRIDFDINNYFDESTREGYSVKIFTSSSSGLNELESKRDLKHVVSYSSDLKLYKDDDIKTRQPVEEVNKIVK